MARYALNLPVRLKEEAEERAREQGVSLNQFIMWAVAEKVGELRDQLADPDHPNIVYRRGASGIPTPVVRSTGVRVQTVATAVRRWELTPEAVAADYDLPLSVVREALAFYDAHRREVDASIGEEEAQAPSS